MINWIKQAVKGRQRSDEPIRSPVSGLPCSVCSSAFTTKSIFIDMLTHHSTIPRESTSIKDATYIPNW